jgi:hypothetical protein
MVAPLTVSMTSSEVTSNLESQYTNGVIQVGDELYLYDGGNLVSLLKSFSMAKPQFGLTVCNDGEKPSIKDRILHEIMLRNLKLCYSYRRLTFTYCLYILCFKSCHVYSKASRKLVD